MEKEVYIDIDKQMLIGNILDISVCKKTEGLIYNLLKFYDKNIEVDVVNGKVEKKYIEENLYENCILFFSLRGILLKSSKRMLFRDIYKLLKEDGIVHIWDIDKGYNKKFNGTIKLIYPDKKIKTIRIIDRNIIKDCSKENTIKLMSKYFDIIDFKCENEIYFIKGKKKGQIKDETTFNRD
jgi:hypothetical protein